MTGVQTRLSKINSQQVFNTGGIALQYFRNKFSLNLSRLANTSAPKKIVIDTATSFAIAREFHY
ncbi:MAG: hypothetical protein ACK4M7_08820, partial [Burkholderiales bacterium]